MKPMPILSLALLALAAGPPARAAEAMTVKIDGEKVRGEVVRVTPKEVVMKVKGAEQSYPALLLEPPAYLACARAILDPKDAKAHHELGTWCREKGLTKEADELLAEATRLDPAAYPKDAPAAAAAPDNGQAAPASEPKKSLKDLLAMLGDEDFQTRKAAMEGLRELGEKIKPELEKAEADAKDAEVKASVTLLLREIVQGKTWTELTSEERAIAELPFDNEKPGATRLKISVRGEGTFTVLDVGNRIRLAIRDQPFTGRASSTVTLGGGGRGMSQAGNLSVSSHGGKADCAFLSTKFTVSKDTLRIGDQTIPRDEACHVIFVGSKGDFEKAVVVPGTQKKKEEQTAEK